MPKKETEVLCKILCTRCGKEGYVPFIADGSRNYYCAECLTTFNVEKKRGTVKEVKDPKGRSRYEFICDICLRLKRSSEQPKKSRGQLMCAECAEKEKRTQRSAGRKRIAIANKED